MVASKSQFCWTASFVNVNENVFFSLCSHFLPSKVIQKVKSTFSTVLNCIRSKLHLLHVDIKTKCIYVSCIISQTFLRKIHHKSIMKNALWIQNSAKWKCIRWNVFCCRCQRHHLLVTTLHFLWQPNCHVYQIENWSCMQLVELYTTNITHSPRCIFVCIHFVCKSSSFPNFVFNSFPNEFDWSNFLTIKLSFDWYVRHT